MYTNSQQLPKSFHRFSADLLVMKVLFWNPVSVSTICNTCLCFIHMRSIAIYLLNVMFSLRIVILNLNGGTEYSDHCSHFSEIYSKNSFTCRLLLIGNALLNRFSSLPGELGMNRCCILRSSSIVTQQL